MWGKFCYAPHATDGRKICQQGPLVVTYQKSFCGMHTIMSSSKRLSGNYLCLSRCILCEIWTSPNMITCNCSFIHAILFRRFVGPGEVLNAGWKATWLPTVQITASLALYVNQNRARNLRSPHRNRLDKRKSRTEHSPICGGSNRKQHVGCRWLALR